MAGRMRFLGLGIFMVLALAGCSEEEAPSASPVAGLTNRAVAKVNGVPIMSDTVSLMVSTWGEAYERQGGQVDYELMRKMQQQKLEQLINQEVIRQRVKECSVTASEEEVKATISRMIDDLGGSDEFLNYLQERGYVTFEQLEEEVREDLKAQKVFTRDMHLKEPEEKDLRAYYEKCLPAMIVPETIGLSHIQIPLEKRALPGTTNLVYPDVFLRHIKGQIESNYLTFAHAAREYSVCRSSQHAGMVGNLRRGDTNSMPKVIHDAAFRLGVSNVSDVVVSSLGAHLLYVTKRTPCYTNSFEDAREVLKSYLNREILEKNRYDWIIFLRNRAEIRYLEEP